MSPTPRSTNPTTIRTPRPTPEDRSRTAVNSLTPSPSYLSASAIAVTVTKAFRSLLTLGPLRFIHQGTRIGPLEHAPASSMSSCTAKWAWTT